jgi:hypothetical protein
MRCGPVLRPVVERGVRRSELRPDTDARLLLETLVAPLQGRLLLAGEPLSADLAEPIVDLVLYGATPRWHPITGRSRRNPFDQLT